MPKTDPRKDSPPPLYVTGMNEEERDNLAAFCEALGQPASWVARDALRCYTEALWPHVEALRKKLADPGIRPKDAGKTPQRKRGRPLKPGAKRKRHSES